MSIPPVEVVAAVVAPAVVALERLVKVAPEEKPEQFPFRHKKEQSH